jgi:hypothetical protein
MGKQLLVRVTHGSGRVGDWLLDTVSIIEVEKEIIEFLDLTLLNISHLLTSSWYQNDLQRLIKPLTELDRKDWKLTSSILAREQAIGF